MSNQNQEEEYYEEEYDWMLDSIAEYLKSPEWKNPIIDFIDEHCVVFDDEDENKLEYTTIHRDFKKIVDSKLDKFMKEFGIPEDTFLIACQAASSKIHKSVINQILAVDNFLLFKKMMITRNKQFNEWALKKVKQKDGKINEKHQEMAAKEREEAELQQAIEESKALEEKRQARLKQEKEHEEQKQKKQEMDNEPQGDSPKKENVFSELPSLMQKKAAVGGFDEINIEESKEKIQQERDLIRKSQNEERQKELESYRQEKEKNKSAEEEKNDRIKKGLEALKAKEGQSSIQEQRKNYMNDLRDALVTGGIDDDQPLTQTKQKKKHIEILSKDIL